MSASNAPWESSYGDLSFHLTYPSHSISDQVLTTAKDNPELTALSFMGSDISYRTLAERIEQTAKAFAALGIREGDVVTLCMPNVPQTVYCLYALNRIGAIASMVHPLSAVGELVFYLKEVKSRTVLTLDQFYPKMKEVTEQYPVDKLLITSVGDALPGVMKIGYALTQGRKIKKVTPDSTTVLWKDFLAGGQRYDKPCAVNKKDTDAAVILFSGGTTGKTKAILLSNLNFNALALQTAEMSHCQVKGKSMLAAMPMFHGFGLGVCVHTMLACGGRSILVPRFNVSSYAKLVTKERPNFIAGVPTLYEALTRSKEMDKAKLDCLYGVFSGGDSLSIELKKKLDKFLADHGASVRVREGYGTTECVTASCLTPFDKEKEGSIGIPYPDTYYAICGVGTNEELPYGEEGEICLRGPSVMLGYLNHPEENADTLRVHADGHTWLHTGDLGSMDEEGFVYFKQRIKRMIITSGYNVYPSQLENIIEAHEAVQMSCVIGVRDPYKIQKVKAFVVLRPGFAESEELKESLFAHCRKHIAKYAMPYEIEIRGSLPKTLVGKVAYTVLEKEEEARTEQAAAPQPAGV